MGPEWKQLFYFRGVGVGLSELFKNVRILFFILYLEHGVAQVLVDGKQDDLQEHHYQVLNGRQATQDYPESDQERGSGKVCTEYTGQKSAI
jgi:hypothetical protein